jgi:hypothetical protein
MRKLRNSYDDDQPWCPPLTVYEPVVEPIDTGVFDASGNKIFRRNERPAIGFHLQKVKS